MQYVKHALTQIRKSS